MSMAETIKIDTSIMRKKDAKKAIEDDLDSSNILPGFVDFGGEEVLSEIWKAYYPTYLVKFSYESTKGILSKKKVNKTVTCFVDAFTEWNNNTSNLQRYNIEHREINTVSSEIFAEDFAVVFPATGTTPEDAVNLPRTSPDLVDAPRGYDPDKFEGSDKIDRVYLPFWVAYITTQEGSTERFVSFRGSADNGELNKEYAEWLSELVRTRDVVRVGLKENGRIQVSSDKKVEGFVDSPPQEIHQEVQNDSNGNRTTKKIALSEHSETPGSNGGKNMGNNPQEADRSDVTNTEYVTEAPPMDFEDAGGMDELKRNLRDKIIHPIQNPDRYQEYSLSTVNGVLLYGPPGTGKTYLSKALAGELGYNYAEINPSDLVGSSVGGLPNRIADVFEEAREHQPTVVFIDEIDSIAAERTDSDTRTENQGVNQLLQELSNLNESDDDVVVIAATNKPDQLDPALVRNGRLDIKQEVPYPDEEARAIILQKQLQDRPVADDVAWELLADETEGMSAAALETIAETAAFNALQKYEDIHHKHLVKAIRETETGTDISVDTDLLDPTPEIGFDDVGGMGKLKDELRREVIEPIRNSERFEEYELDVVNGVLLHGPPGTGKTYMSKALAGEMDMNYAKIEPDDILSKYVNESAKNVGEIFDKARENAPCLVFIDEIDAIASKRGGANKHQDQDNTVNQLLNELSEVNEGDEEVVVVAATNNLDGVDGAAKRSGRFDKKVRIPPRTRKRGERF